MPLPWDENEIAVKLKSRSSDVVAKTLATIVFKRPELLEHLPRLTKTLQDASDISDPKSQASVLAWIDSYRSNGEGDAKVHPDDIKLQCNGQGMVEFETPDTRSGKVQSAVSEVQDLEDVAPPPDMPTAILQFSTSVYYAKEGEDKEMSLDVMRLGADDQEISCHFRTVDGDGKAGSRYIHVEGDLVFKPGEIMKQIQVPIIESRAWSSSLEFKVVLSDIKGPLCMLGRYLYMCRVKVIDPDCFPTNRFSKEIRHNNWRAIPMFSLLSEYFKYNYHSNPVVNRRSKHQLITDQISNLYFILRLYIGKVVIDKILRTWSAAKPDVGCNPDGEAPGGRVFAGLLVKCPEDPSATDEKYPLLIMCSIIIVIPMFMVHFLEFREVYFKIGGTSRKTLQGNLVRKFLNYDESSRAQLGPSDLIMGMTRDTQSLVHDGYMQLFPLAQNLGKLLLMVLLQLAIGARYAPVVVVIYPIVLLMVLLWRNELTRRMAVEQDDAQNELVNYVTQIMTTYRLIGDYLKRPDAVEATEAKVGNFNKRMIASDAVNLNNRFSCQWLSLICVAIWFIVGGNLVISGGSELGTFVTNLQIFNDVGQAWTAIFEVMLKMQSALPYLQKIVKYMNLPIDLEKRMRLNRNRRARGEEARVQARDEMMRQKASGKKLHGAFAADFVPISLVNVAYAYETPQAIYNRMLAKDHVRNSMVADKDGEDLEDGQPRVGSLQNVTMNFEQGKLIALVGLPGDGKSTLMKILGSQIIPDSGDLLIPPHLRALHISPNPTFFSDSLMSNMTYGVAKDDKDGSIERVTAICRMLLVSDKVLKYLDPNDPDMFNVKADWGDILSQTQRTLVSLARALIANPEILVIHKPTVVLDDATTQNTFKCLRKFVREKGVCMDRAMYASRRPRTCVITTARPTGVAAADHVFRVTPMGVLEEAKNEVTEEMLN